MGICGSRLCGSWQFQFQLKFNVSIFPHFLYISQPFYQYQQERSSTSWLFFRGYNLKVKLWHKHFSCFKGQLHLCSYRFLKLNFKVEMFPYFPPTSLYVVHSVYKLKFALAAPLLYWLKAVLKSTLNGRATAFGTFTFIYVIGNSIMPTVHCSKVSNYPPQPNLEPSMNTVK